MSYYQPARMIPSNESRGISHTDWGRALICIAVLTMIAGSGGLFWAIIALDDSGSGAVNDGHSAVIAKGGASVEGALVDRIGTPLSSGAQETAVTKSMSVIDETDSYPIAPEAAMDVVAAAVHHALGTAHVSFSTDGVRLGGEQILLLRAEMMPMSMADAARIGLGPALMSLPPMTNVTIECVDDLVAGFYVRASCMAPYVEDLVRCSLSFEMACLSPGRARLPPARQYDPHNKKWVFSYTAKSSYVP